MRSEETRKNEKAQEYERHQSVNRFHTKIAGVTFNNEGANTENRQRIIRDLLSKGLLEYGQALELRQEPQNHFDHQAVAVFGPDGRQLGYIPKEVAHRMFAKMQCGDVYSAFVSKVTGGSAGLSYGINLLIEESRIATKHKDEDVGFRKFSKLEHAQILAVMREELDRQEQKLLQLQKDAKEAEQKVEWAAKHEKELGDEIQQLYDELKQVHGIFTWKKKHDIKNKIKRTKKQVMEIAHERRKNKEKLIKIKNEIVTQESAISNQKETLKSKEK